MEAPITSQESAAVKAWSFLRAKRATITALSALVVIPCLWHRRIEAGDLASHVYNAWLARLVQKGQAPGVYAVPQWNNVLFDWMLLYLGKAVGFAAGEKIAVSLCVLVFFWGVFALMNAVSGKAPWLLTPCIGVLAYGYSFNMGFVNYYLSVGLACFSLAVAWRGKGADLVAGVALALLTLLAHPLGFVWLTGALLYLSIWRRLRNWWNLILPAAAIGGFIALHWYFLHRAHFPVDWLEQPFYLFNGADQLAVYGPRYVWIAVAAFILGAVFFSIDLAVRWGDAAVWNSLRLPLELYTVAFCATSLLPEDLQPPLYPGWIGLLVTRLTTISAILGLCVMSVIQPRKWHLAGFSACAAVFFVFLYQDTLILTRMESSAEHLVRELPPGTRVLSTIWAPPDSRVQFIGHIVDRACIGHCFSYSNYEPSSWQFRLRVRPGSPVATASNDESEDMQAGQYEVQDEDLPMMEVYQCDEKDLTKLCMRALVPGEKNGRLGYKPPSE